MAKLSKRYKVITYFISIMFLSAAVIILLAPWPYEPFGVVMFLAYVFFVTIGLTFPYWNDWFPKKIKRHIKTNKMEVRSIWQKRKKRQKK